MSAAATILSECQRKLEKARGGAGWFTSGGGRVDHGTYRSVLAPYHDRVYHEGRCAWAALVMAQPGLYAMGDFDSTGTVVYSFDRQFDGEPQALERIAASVGALKNAMPKDALLVTFAAEVRNDTPREIDRLVPLALTAGRQVRYETIYIQRHRLPTRYLAGQFFPVILSTSQPTQPMLLPLEEWSPTLVQAWQDAARKKPPAQQPVSRKITGAYEDPYVVDAPPANNGGMGYGGAPAARGGGIAHAAQNTSGFAGPHGVPPVPPVPTYGNQGASHSGGYGNAYPAAPSHAPAHHANRAAPRLDAAAEAFAQNPLRLTEVAASSLRLCARQQSLSDFKVRISAGDAGHRLDFAHEQPDPTTDFVYESSGITLVVDVKAARNLSGVQVDLGQSSRGIGFVFRRVA